MPRSYFAREDLRAKDGKYQSGPVVRTQLGREDHGCLLGWLHPVSLIW
jgi:hypothetical protein